MSDPAIIPHSVAATGLRPGGRLPALDGLRGIAVLVVMIHHFMPDWPANAGLAGWFSHIVHTGWWGVDLFFVLSGFLITGILYDAKGEDGYFKNFYMRRILRICPVYYGLLAFLFIGLPLISHADSLFRLLQIPSGAIASFLGDLPEKQAWLWLYLVNIRIAVTHGSGTGDADFSYLTPLWSLSVEEHFYLVWPFLIWRLRRQTIMWVCVGLCVAALVGRAGCVIAGTSSVVPYMLTPFRMDSLAIGGLAAMLIRSPRGLTGIYPAARLALLGLLPVVGLVLAISVRPDPLMIIFGYTVISAFFAALLLVVVCGTGDGRLNTSLRWPFLQTFGKYSYALYASHLIVRHLMEATLPAGGQAVLFGSRGLGGICFTVIGIAVSLAVAFASWHLMEKHFLKLKRFFESQPAPQADLSVKASSRQVPGIVGAAGHSS